MTDAGAPRPGYDAIAHLYDVDMARNMPFDDVGLYARLCAASPGPALELGCGNGRITLDLLARGVDVTGVDGAARMLAALVDKARSRGLPEPRVCRMDVRALGFKPGFAIVLCPYSLVTYMTADMDAPAMLREARRVLAPGGVVVVDAFVPRPAVTSGEYTQDYARPYAGGTLVRSKRVTALSPRVNRIERRYDALAADGSLQERVETREEIRTFTPSELLALLDGAGLRVRSTWWDYASNAARGDARFFTAVAEAR